MTEEAFKGIRPTAPDHVGLLVKFYIGRYGLMLWSEQHNVKSLGWVVYYLDDEMQPLTGRFIGTEPMWVYIDDVHLQVVGIASNNPVGKIPLTEVCGKRVRSKR